MKEESTIIQERVGTLIEERQKHIAKAKEIEKQLSQISREHGIAIPYEGR